mgnify:CR=1 FL=1
MTFIRNYILTIVSAAMLCALLKSISTGKKGIEKILGLVAGIFLLATGLQPLGILELSQLENPIENYRSQAERTVAQAEKEVQMQLGEQIQEQTQAYILDKANTLGMSLEVQVDKLVPCQVTLTGPTSPYAKQQLKAILETELGIPEERQVWNT